MGTVEARCTAEQNVAKTGPGRHAHPPTPPFEPIEHRYMVGELVRKGIPVITPAGGLGVHVDAMRFVDHIPQTEVGCTAGWTA